MQLRKSATAILALALSAGLAQAEDTAPTAGSTLDKIAKNGVTTTSKKWWVTLRIIPTPLSRQ